MALIAQAPQRANAHAHADESTALEARARRAWRIALICYLIPITIATHWPRLGFPGAGMIDKFIHFLGFGVLAWMWMHAAPWGRALVGFVCAAAWVYIDERTQALEILGRTFSGYDMLAGWIGVLFAGGIFMTRWVRVKGLEPEGATIDSLMYASAKEWRRAAVVCITSILIIGGAMFWWDCAEGATASYPTAIYPIGFSGLIGLALATILGRVRARAEYARREGVEIRRPHPRVWTVLLCALIVWMLDDSFTRLVVHLFAGDDPAQLSADHEGFLVLRQGVLVGSILFGLAFLSMISPRSMRGTLSS